MFTCRYTHTHMRCIGDVCTTATRQVRIDVYAYIRICHCHACCRMGSTAHSLHFAMVPFEPSPYIVSWCRWCPKGAWLYTTYLLPTNHRSICKLHIGVCIYGPLNAFCKGVRPKCCLFTSITCGQCPQWVLVDIARAQCLQSYQLALDHRWHGCKGAEGAGSFGFVFELMLRHTGCLEMGAQRVP